MQLHTTTFAESQNFHVHPVFLSRKTTSPLAIPGGPGALPGGGAVLSAAALLELLTASANTS